MLNQPIDKVKDSKLFKRIKKFFSDYKEYKVKLLEIETQGDIVTIDVSLDVEKQFGTPEYVQDGFVKQFVYDIKYQLEKMLLTEFDITPVNLQGIKTNKNQLDAIFELSFIYRNTNKVEDRDTID